MAVYKDIVSKISVPADKKTKQKEYKKSGKIPIVDQGQNLIGGYTDDDNKVLNCEKPVIIFGDHTCAVKFISFPFGVGADGVKVLKPKADVLPKYLYYGTQYLVLQLQDRGYARHYQHIEKMNLPIFSIPEQEKIVAKIEELFSQIDEGIETLTKTKEQLKKYRQAVLKNAFDNIEGEEYTIGEACEDVKVGIVIKPSQYYTSEKDGTKAFRSANVREFHIDDFDWVYLSQEGQEKNKRTIVHTGDVLVVRSGYPGTACVVTEKFDGCNAIDVLIAVPNQKLVLPEYLCAYTNSPLGKMFVAEKKRGVGQKHFNVGGYTKMKIIIPDFIEQQRIVLEIDNKLSVCNMIEKTVDESLQQAEAFKYSILKKAFEGRLV